MTLSPTEKAKELVEKFTPCTKDFYEDKGWVGNIERAKEAAIILCDEVLAELDKLNKPEYTIFVTSITPIRAENGYERIEYYKSVRSEIEKL